MDVTAAKTKAIIDAAAGSKPKSTAEQLAGDFSAAVAERMKMSSQSVAGQSKTSLAETLSSKPSAKPEPKADTQPAEVAPRDDHQPRERVEAPEQPRDDTSRPIEAKNDAPRDTLQQDAPRNDTAKNDRGDDGANQQQASSDGDQAQNDGAPEQQAQSGDDGGAADTGEAVTQTADDQSNVGQGEQVVAAVVDMIGKTDINQGANANQNGAAKTQEAVSAQQTATGPSQTGDQLGDVDLAIDSGQKKVAANSGQQQAQNQANLQQKTDGAHTLNSDAALKQQQAADIASKVGSDQKMNVNVTVSKQSEQLVSQPTANLGAQAALADDANATTQTATQAAARTAAPGSQIAPSHNLGNQAGQQQGSDAQQQAQQQLQMAQAEAAKNVTATDTKSQGLQTAANHAATAKVGGAEGMNNAQGLTQTNTAQATPQPATPQKAAANPHAQHRAAVTEQVNVQITKAIANGIDKINIQLRPAHLGRIDVQLEMASDGRVTAVVTADNKDTLDLLKQDSRELERAMREAGLQMGSGDLSFNLRENGGQPQGGEETAGRGPSSGPLTNEPTLDELLEASARRPNIISEDRVDITA